MLGLPVTDVALPLRHRVACLLLQLTDSCRDHHGLPVFLESQGLGDPAGTAELPAVWVRIWTWSACCLPGRTSACAARVGGEGSVFPEQLPAWDAVLK